MGFSRDAEEIIDLAVMKGVPVQFATKSDLNQLSRGMCHQVLFLFC
jgi:tRNA G18 (ribose-2'-O)-methylase SpoU